MGNMDKRKFYIPIAVKFNKGGEAFNFIDELEDIDGTYYASKINDSIKKSLENSSGRGLADNLFANAGRKTCSLYPSVEVHNHELVGVITFETQLKYTERDNVVFLFWIEHKMGEEWAEDFEKIPIQAEDGEIYISFFPSDREITIQTEEQFFGKMQHEGMQMS